MLDVANELGVVRGVPKPWRSRLDNHEHGSPKGVHSDDIVEDDCRDNGSMSFAINLFDFLLIAVLVAGLLYGRKQGLSIELLASAKWLTLLLGCAALYRPTGMLVSQAAGLNLLTGYLLSGVQKRLAPRLAGTDAFGRAEYYLGMVSGLVQFGCMLLMALALLNARAFSPAELKALEQYQEAAYGSSDFPNLHSFQAAVFERSLFGPWIQQDLGFLLIDPTEVGQSEPNRLEQKRLPTTAKK